MFGKILIAGAAFVALSTPALAQQSPNDDRAPTTPAQTTPPSSPATGDTAVNPSRPDTAAPSSPSMEPAAPSTSSGASTAGAPAGTSDEPGASTGMRGDSGYGPGWDAGKCAAAKKNGTKTNSGDCPATARPR